GTFSLATSKRHNKAGGNPCFTSQVFLLMVNTISKQILFSSESEKCDSWSPKTNSKLTLIY
ncbi:hypothetical protein, partial [Vibrio parahaemolyticus]